MMDNAPVKGWNYAPSVPIQVSPIFTWPWKPYEIIKWIWNSWFLITEKLIIVGLAFCSFYWFQPPLSDMKALSIDWVLVLYLRNMA
ncbi:MAG: sterol desaturase family protein, partial [Rhodobacterales bacterium]|nr:sterol desaturase family protein [Rhodobacterales bacterium]